MKCVPFFVACLLAIVMVASVSETAHAARRTPVRNAAAKVRARVSALDLFTGRVRACNGNSCN